MELRREDLALLDLELLEPPGVRRGPYRGPLGPAGDLHRVPPRPPGQQDSDRPAQHGALLVSEATGSPRAPRRRPLALQGILRGGELVSCYEGTAWPTMLSSDPGPWPVDTLLADAGMEPPEEEEDVPGAPMQPDATLPQPS